MRTQSAVARPDSSSAESDADIAEQVEAAKAHITYYDDDEGESEVDHQGFISISDETGYEESAFMGFFNEGDFDPSDEELVSVAEEVPYEDLPEGSDTRFNFGQHKGETYNEVIRSNPSYFRWGVKERKPSVYLKKYLVWVHRFYHVPEKGDAVLRER